MIRPIRAIHFTGKGCPVPEGMHLWPDEKGSQPRDMSFGYVETENGRVHVQGGDWIQYYVDGTIRVSPENQMIAIGDQAIMVEAPTAAPVMPPIPEQLKVALTVYESLRLDHARELAAADDAMARAKRYQEDISKQQTLLESLWKSVQSNAPRGSMWNSAIRDSSL